MCDNLSEQVIRGCGSGRVADLLVCNCVNMKSGSPVASWGVVKITTCQGYVCCSLRCWEAGLLSNTIRYPLQQIQFVSAAQQAMQ